MKKTCTELSNEFNFHFQRTPAIEIAHSITLCDELAAKWFFLFKSVALGTECGALSNFYKNQRVKKLKSKFN